MKAPLDVMRVELLKLIRELERMRLELRDAKATVPTRWTQKLQRLRRVVERTQSPAELERAWQGAEELMIAAASELVKRWLW